MRLESLDIQRLPGVQPGFRLEAVDPGVNVVVGPNAAGKSSLLRALRAVLYAQEQRQAGVYVEATLVDAQGRLEAHRRGNELYWTRDGVRIDPPLLPDHRFLACYTLRIEDLLDAQHATEQAIGAHLARELAGGYDLRALRQDPALALKKTHGRAEARALAAATEEVRQQARYQRGLLADEERLAELKERRRVAQRASDEAAQHERALDLLETRREHQTLRARLQTLPAGLDRLQGDELETLDDLQGEVRRLEQEQRQARQRAEAARARRRATGLNDSELDTQYLGELSPRIRRLQDLENRHEQTLRESHRARKMLERAITDLGGEPATLPALDPGTVEEVHQSLDTLRELRAAITWREEALSNLPEPDRNLPSPNILRYAREELLHWLAAPRPVLWNATRMTAGMAVLLTAAGAIGVAAAFVHEALAALALPVAWGAYILLRPGSEGILRQAARARYRETGLEPPRAWTPEAVRLHLAGLEPDLREAEDDHRTRQRRTQLERELRSRREMLAREQARLRQVAQEVGFDPTTLDASLERWIRLTMAHDQARQTLTTVQADQERLEAELEAIRAPLIRFLAEHGSTPSEPFPAAAVLEQGIEQLRTRLGARDEARREEQAAERESERLDHETGRTRERIAALYARAGLETGDETALRERLQQRPEWRALKDREREIRAREDDRGRHLAQRPDLLAQVEANAEEDLRQRLRELHEGAAERDALSEEIARIETAIDRARHERQLETARAREAQARDALTDRLDEALLARAGDFLLDQVEAEHEQAIQPAALRRARDWFQRFTRHQYELLFSGNMSVQFAARETASGATRSLAELSSGTRMQLLLAVRIAFALEAERGRSPLPLFLDEALGTADPERFRAATQSLQMLVEETGRQVFYLTAQPEDARYWARRDTEVRVIDLAALRWGQQTRAGGERLALPEPAAVPAPGDRTPEDYAALLGGVPLIEPWEDPARIHLFHLLRDRLDLLQRLLQLGVTTLGALESLLHGPTAGTLLDATEGQALQARVDAARTWVKAWRQGRGRPVDRAALEASGLITDTFIGPLGALSEQLDGDAEALVRELENGAIKRFQSATRERLEAWLIEQGYIDRVDPYTDAELTQRVMATLHTRLPGDEQAIAAGRTLARSLQTGLQGI